MTWLVQSPRPRPSLLRHQGPLVATLPAAGRISKILGKKSSKWQPVYSVFILSSAFGVQVGFFWALQYPNGGGFRFSNVFLVCISQWSCVPWKSFLGVCSSPPQCVTSHPHNPKHLAILQDIFAFWGVFPSTVCHVRCLAARLQDCKIPRFLRSGADLHDYRLLSAPTCMKYRFYRFHIVLYIYKADYIPKTTVTTYLKRL